MKANKATYRTFLGICLKGKKKDLLKILKSNVFFHYHIVNNALFAIKKITNKKSNMATPNASRDQT